MKDDIKKYEMIDYFIGKNSKIIVNIGSLGYPNPKDTIISLHDWLKKKYNSKLMGVDFRQHENIDVYQDPKDSKIALQDEYADVLIMDGVLEHSYKPLDTLEECYRILKPNGTLIVTTSNSTSILYLFGVMKYGFENQVCYAWNMSMFSNLVRNTKFNIVYQDDFDVLGENFISKVLRGMLAIFPVLRTNFITVLRKPSEYESLFKGTKVK